MALGKIIAACKGLLDQLGITSGGVYTPPSAPGAWTAFTPTSTWTANATHSGHYLLVGNVMFLRYWTILSGAPTTATYEVSLPSGYYVDEAAIVNSITDEPLLGSGAINDSGWKYPLVPCYASANNRIGARAVTTHPSHISLTQASPITFGNDDRIHLWAVVPVTTVAP